MLLKWEEMSLVGYSTIIVHKLTEIQNQNYQLEELFTDLFQMMKAADEFSDE